MMFVEQLENRRLMSGDSLIVGISGDPGNQTITVQNPFSVNGQDTTIDVQISGDATTNTSGNCTSTVLSENGVTEVPSGTSTSMLGVFVSDQSSIRAHLNNLQSSENDVITITYFLDVPASDTNPLPSQQTLLTQTVTLHRVTDANGIVRVDQATVVNTPVSA